jgi:hypothetical protein
MCFFSFFILDPGPVASHFPGPILTKRVAYDLDKFRFPARISTYPDSGRSAHRGTTDRRIFFCSLDLIVEDIYAPRGVVLRCDRLVRP